MRCATKSSAPRTCRSCRRSAASPPVATSPRRTRSPKPAGGEAQVGAGRALDPAASRAGDRLARRRRRARCADRHRRPGRCDRRACSTRSASTRSTRFVGCSYGAMVGLQFAARASGSALRQLVAISGAHRAHPYRQRLARAAAQRGRAGRSCSATKRRACRWRGSWRCSATARRRNSPSASTRAAIGRRPRARAPPRTSWTHCGARYAHARPPTAFLRLSESIDLHARRPAHDPRAGDAWSRSQEDRLVPLDGCLSRWPNACAAPARLRVLRSPYGHDAFLKETDGDRAILARSAGAAATGGCGMSVAVVRSTARRARRHRPRHRLRRGRRRRWCCRAISASPASTTSATTTTRAAAIPTRDLLGEALAELEGGAGGVVTATGMAAITLVLNALLQARRSRWWCRTMLRRQLAPVQCAGEEGRTSNWSPPTSPIRARSPTRWRSRPTLVWIETPSNPLLRITDLRFVIDAAHTAGALAVVDNTFLSPALQQPIAFGADLVVHSTTKYINGHSDVVGGAVIARDAGAARAAGVVGERARPHRLAVRQLPDPARPAHARMRACACTRRTRTRSPRCSTTHPAVRAVHYPGLAAHPGHALAARQQHGLRRDARRSNSTAACRRVRAFVDGLRCFTLAESLGGVESLIAHPATMTHAAMSPEARAAAGIGDGLLRLSVGIEHADDLLADIAGSRASKRAHAVACVEAAPRGARRESAHRAHAAVALLGTGQRWARAVHGARLANAAGHANRAGLRARSHDRRHTRVDACGPIVARRCGRRQRRASMPPPASRRRAACRVAGAGHARRHRLQAGAGHIAGTLARDPSAPASHSGARYGDSATVGAGLPLLRIDPRAAGRRRPHPRDRRRAVGFAGVAVRPLRRPASVLAARARGARGRLHRARSARWICPARTCAASC